MLESCRHGEPEQASRFVRGCMMTHGAPKTTTRGPKDPQGANAGTWPPEAE